MDDPKRDLDEFSWYIQAADKVEVVRKYPRDGIDLIFITIDKLLDWWCIDE